VLPMFVMSIQVYSLAKENRRVGTLRSFSDGCKSVSNCHILKGLYDMSSIGDNINQTLPMQL